MEQRKIEIKLEEETLAKLEVIARSKGCTPEELIVDYMWKGVELYQKSKRLINSRLPCPF